MAAAQRIADARRSTNYWLHYIGSHVSYMVDWISGFLPRTDPIAALSAFALCASYHSAILADPKLRKPIAVVAVGAELCAYLCMCMYVCICLYSMYVFVLC